MSIEGNPILKAKYDDYKNAFAASTKITFAAPTSTTTNSAIASDFTKGIQVSPSTLPATRAPHFCAPQVDISSIVQEFSHCIYFCR